MIRLHDTMRYTLHRSPSTTRVWVRRVVLRDPVHSRVTQTLFFRRRCIAMQASTVAKTHTAVRRSPSNPAVVGKTRGFGTNGALRNICHARITSHPFSKRLQPKRKGPLILCVFLNHKHVQLRSKKGRLVHQVTNSLLGRLGCSGPYVTVSPTT